MESCHFVLLVTVTSFIMASRFPFAIAHVRIPSFFRLNPIPFCVCHHIYLVPSSTVDSWVTGTFCYCDAYCSWGGGGGVLIGVQPLFPVCWEYALIWMWRITGKPCEGASRNWHTVFHIACTIPLDFFYGKIIMVYGSTPIGLSIYPLVSICTISPFWVL